MRNHLKEVPADATTAGNPARPPQPTDLTLSNGLTLPSPGWPGLEGLHERLAYAAYDKDLAARHSLVNLFQDRTPLAVKAYIESGDSDSTARTIGRVFHSLIDGADDFVVVDASDRRTKIYQAAAAASPGKDVVLRSEMDELLRMRDSFQAHSMVQSLLKGATREASVFWKDPGTGLRLKARPDVLSKAVLLDVKTTRDFKALEADAEGYGYFRQAAWYADGVRAVTGWEFDRFLIVAVEKKAPYDVRVYEVGPRAMKRAREQNIRNLETYAECLHTQEWRGHAQVIEVLSP